MPISTIDWIFCIPQSRVEGEIMYTFCVIRWFTVHLAFFWYYIRKHTAGAILLSLNHESVVTDARGESVNQHGVQIPQGGIRKRPELL